MRSRPFAGAKALLVLGLAAFALGGCGKLGDLERPGPMFGHAPAGAAERNQNQDPNRPVQTVDPRDPNTSPATPREPQ
ncbi:hypothetical protein [Phenylobacterium soli]|uniref:Uncharacterized protein n=1 Tax=Phenylobacterium soli TaxID=2170551 RepID=A0A328ABK3_9CAUL|nr:hypothetical protein [Phenylobacterium soli]RAK51837.1 hypothetical protein DJ017_18650 [Phenylobacterium soli]